MRLVVILPALNEEKTIETVLHAIPSEIEGISRTIKLVIDDGSIDQTAELAKKAGATVISHGRQRGLGQVFRTGRAFAMKHNADIMVSIDSDGQFNPEHIEQIVKPITNGEADFVTATRFAIPELVPKMPYAKLKGNKFMTRLINFLSRGNCNLTDVSCGFRAYSKEALVRLNLFGRYTYTQEVILSLALSDLRLTEVPVKVRGQREFGKSRIAHNLFIYGTQTLKIILRTYRDYRPLSFFFGAATMCAAPGAVFLSIVIVHYLLAQRITPHKWAALLAGICFLSALLLIVTGLLADMNSRTRLSLEELLFFKRRQEMDQQDKQDNS